MKMSSRVAVCAALVLSWAVSGVQATELTGAPDTVTTMLFQGSELVQGSTAMVTPLQLDTAGSLSLTLTDMNFPESLGALSFAVTDANTLLKSMDGPGVMTLDVAGPTTLYADVFATAQGSANVGLFNLQVSFTSLAPVPLPPSGLLLAMILAAMLLFGWRRPSRAHMKL
jgi:hypothetical protein